MRNEYHVHHRYGDQRQVWGYALIALGLLLLFTKPWLFPLLFIFGMIWFAGRRGCGWQGVYSDEAGKAKRKPKNDDGHYADDEVIII